MGEKSSRIGYTLYHCPKCLKPSLLEVDFSLYRCIACSSLKTESSHQQDSDDNPPFWSMLLTMFFLLIILL